MKFNFSRARKVVSARMVSYHYLNENTFFKLIGWIMRNRRKKLHITADFGPALKKYGIPAYQQTGYVRAAADFFNLKGTPTKNGRSWRMFKH